MAIRRLDSFQRMDQIMDAVDMWFFNDDEFGEVLNRFAEDHCMDFKVDESGTETNADGDSGVFLFSPDEPDEFAEDLKRRAHKRREVHMQYQTLFEGHLETILSSFKITSEQFQQVFQMSQDEEVRYGQKFHRWIDATDYVVFLKMMQSQYTKKTTHDDSQPPAVMFLRCQIRQKMEEARLALRRRKEIRPLLDKWGVDDFVQLVKVLQAPECPLIQGKKQERKFMARWRIKLTQQQRDSGSQKTDRAIMTEYVGRAAEELTSEEFATLMQFLHSHVDGLELDEHGKRRRMAWELFAALDETFIGCVPYNKTLKFLQRNPSERFRNKDWKKVTTKWGAKIKKNNVDKLEIDLIEFVGFIMELLSDVEYEEYHEILSSWTNLKRDLDT
eukprot:CAMPEP_0174303872 /NCGR_PEP_ID=MMETSP0809-20121228/60444_1 /TAXON_ID=73025 ORGANISM="Eutreptiella gymnastica-like, Strain CCMP1594" /NCGR_SAMPLE_ID=MMETSP0809 /ASSEMBLY_ACC=CAM_ASM_000658 /LENGTH=386 /DNA_ID=CAMNT_0015409981 /DNA_START=92 /DNA_END=1252 /DNA_ORIENTATION=-